MNIEKVKKIRKELIDFYDNENMLFILKIDCQLQDRIKFIYSILFPSFNQKLKFYKNFFLARIAQYIDYSPLKIFLYRFTGMRIGKGVFISPDVILDPHFPNLIKIDDYVILGWGSKLFTHEYADKKYRVGKICISKGVVVGAYSVIRGGVCIGENAEIPYSAVITKDINKDKIIKLPFYSQSNI